MQAKCNIEIEFDSSSIAKNVLKTIKVDNLDFVHSRVENKKLISEINANSVSSLLHTIDDYLACVSVASKVLDKD